jgi:hypothetical protein
LVMVACFPAPIRKPSGQNEEGFAQCGARSASWPEAFQVVNERLHPAAAEWWTGELITLDGQFQQKNGPLARATSSCDFYVRQSAE